MGRDDNETEVIILNKLIRSAVALLTSLSMISGAVPLSSVAEELSTVSGILDMSDVAVSFGEYEDLNLTFDFPDIRAQTNGEASYYLGDYLDANNKAVYEKLAELVTPSEESITIKLPETVSFSSSTLEISNNTDFYNAVFSSCVSAMEAASFDLPMLFWLDNSLTTVSPNNLRYSFNPISRKYKFTVSELTITPAPYESFSSFAEILEYKDVLESSIADFPVEGETREEKLRSIHDHICNYTVYDLEGRFSGSALSALAVPGAVCEGYSKGFKAICDDLGIPCVCIFGNFNEAESTAHMWNYVLMEDGFWYAVDVTWDDMDGKNGEELNDRFFLKGSDDFFVQHSECSEFLLAKLTYPEIAAWNYGERPGTTTTVVTTSTTVPFPATTETVATAAVTTTAAKPTATTTSPTASSVITTTSVPVSDLYGDVNQDGKVSIADLVYCAMHVLGSKDTPNNCDLNGDGSSDTYDVILMRRIIVEIMENAVKTGRQT